jgi:UDP-N-acetylglucosamine 4-epimerase
VMQLMNHETITINGRKLFTRFHLYWNVIQMNELAMTTENQLRLNTVYNTAFGDRNTLNDLWIIWKNI